MTPFVLDASAALPLVFADEYSEQSQRLATALATTGAVVPAIWPLEIANAILMAIRRGRLREAAGPHLYASLIRLPIEIDSSINPKATATETFHIARVRQISAYDASYLELAQRRGLELATQDARLATAAEHAGIKIYRP